MRLLFGDCALDPARRELFRGGEPIHIEPQVFDLLLYLIQNRDHVVSKDELLSAVWQGRIVSDSTLSTRISAARNAIGDSGARQQLIRTVARKGLRFVGDVTQEPSEPQKRDDATASRPSSADISGDQLFGYLKKWLEVAPFDHHVHEILLNEFARRGRIQEGEEHQAAASRLFEAKGLDCTPLRDAWRAATAQGAEARMAAPFPTVASPGGRAQSVLVASRRASIAVMPFAEQTAAKAAAGGPAGGLAHDVITRLAKLRSLFVIAQGTVFALDERGVGPEAAGRMLNVDYVASGSLQHQGNRLTVRVELVETRTARIVWAEIFNEKADDVFLVLDEIGNKIVAAIANEIEAIERNRAILKPPNSLDAWEAHHRGLWHMYRFNKADNEQAQQFFETAIRLDPTFARAYAGLSFTHFQSAFQGWAKRAREVERAFDAAGQSLMADNCDPAAHWAMGRALWLRGNQDQSVIELEQAIVLSPNFALGHYTLAFVHSQGGDPAAAVRFSDHSRHLSPFDPLLFGMLGARAMALLRLKQFDEAAEWGIKAAARPNAHAHVRAIAAYSLALIGRLDEAHAYMAEVHRTKPDYRVDDFLTAMQFAPEDAALFREAAKCIGAG